MSRHYVTAADVTRALGEVAEIQIVAHTGRGYHASIKFDAVTQVFRVYDHGQMVASHDDVDAAVDAYNSIRPRAVSGGAR